MKKTILVFSALLLAALISCTSVKQYKVLIAGESDNDKASAYEIEKLISREEYNNVFAERNKTIELNGKRIDADYQYSWRDAYYQSDWDIYVCKSKSDYSEFGINRDSGKIDFYNSLPDYENADGEILDFEECLAVATGWLSSRVDPSEYEMTWQENSFDKNIYTFNFVRCIRGIQTEDSARIEVTKYGEITHFYYICLGAMNTDKLPSEAEMQKIHTAIIEKLDDVYSSKSDTYNVEYDEKQVRFVRLNDGKYALVFDYSIKKESPNLDTSYSELINLMVYV